MRWDEVKLIIYDFDGVLTDNRVLVDQNGKESVYASRGDGHGISSIRKLGIRQVIISTEKNDVVERRAEKLELEVIHGVSNKKRTVEEYCEKTGLLLEQTLFIGNDLNDYDAMMCVGMRGCPADAEIEIQQISDWISCSPGGYGVARELYRLLSEHNKRPSAFGLDDRKMEMVKKIRKNDVVAVIPARSGSKGIVNKNIKCLEGYPLIAYSIGAANLSDKITRAIVTTNSEEYAEIARYYGADAPFLRPEDISGDESTDLEFMQHMINWLYDNEGSIPEYFVHLRPTCPLREVRTIDDAIEKFIYADADSLRSASLADKTPYKWYGEEDGYFKPLFPGMELDDCNNARQSFKSTYIPDGYVDLLKSESIIKTGTIHGKRMLAFITPQSVDIDRMTDFNILTDYLKTEENKILNYLRSHFKTLKELKIRGEKDGL